MDTPFATVMLGLALAAVATVLLVIEYIVRREQVRHRPTLPAADQPPTRLPALIDAEVPAEVSRGLALMIGELRRQAAGRPTS